MKLRKSDIILILGLLLASALLWLVFRPGETGATVIVTRGNNTVCELPLNKSRTLNLIDEDLGYNTLVIDNGEAYISQADCGDHTCIRTGKISRDGERIVCLPHKLVIEVTGGDTSAPDASTH